LTQAHAPARTEAHKSLISPWFPPHPPRDNRPLIAQGRAPGRHRSAPRIPPKSPPNLVRLSEVRRRPTPIWPWSTPPGIGCPPPSRPASWRWSRPPRC